MKDIVIGIAILFVFCIVFYGVYWIGKTASYSIFYEDMVIKTISEQVKQACLKGN